MARICIPDYEYKERVARCATILQREGLDALIVNGNEADYANPRYFSGFWPLFERAGVAISADGRAALMVGPESAIFGADRNKLDKTFVLTAYREGADPAYPELKPDTLTMCSSTSVSPESTSASAWLPSWIPPSPSTLPSGKLFPRRRSWMPVR